MRLFLVLAAVLGAFATLLSGCATGAAGPGEPVIAIVGGAIIDPASDGPPLRRDLLVRGRRIVSSGEDLRIPRGARRIDAEGKYITPGLWDAHAHLNALTDVGAAPELYVGFGVLHVRDLGGDLQTLITLRTEINAGTKVGPTIFMAGPTLNGQQSAPFHRVVTNDSEARQAVRDLSAAGVDFIKTHRRTSREALLAMIDEAGKRSLDVYGHVPLAVSWIEASDAGMRSFEHVFTILENELSDPVDPAKSIDDAIARIDGARGEAIFAAMAEANVHLCPTLVAFERAIANPPELSEAKRGALNHFLSYVARAEEAGVPILAGADVSTDPGRSLVRELELLVEAGLTPRKALASATTTPAALLGAPELARFDVGAPAAFLILNSNPLQNINAVRDIDTVVINGRVLDSDELGAFRASAPPVERTSQ